MSVARDEDLDRIELSGMVEALESVDGALIAGRFRLMSLLGRGGYGEVWRAVQLSVDRPVAVKLLRPDVAHRADATRRFEREARLASRLSHPNAVGVIDFGHDADGTLFLVMALIEGPTLRQRIRDRGPLPWREAVRVACRICAALRAAHALGLVHRDLKPGNVLLQSVDGREEPVVIDFGLARIFDDDDDDAITRAHAMVGTPAYMSPEAVRGERLDGRADLYSLGVLLFEMLTGRAPLRGSSAMETASMQLRDVPPALGPLVPGAPAALADVVAALLSKDREERPASAATVAERLEGLLDSQNESLAAADDADLTMAPVLRPGSGSGEGVLPRSSATTVGPEDTTTAAHGARAPALPAKRARSRGAVLVAVAAIGVMAAVGSWGISRSGAADDAAVDPGPPPRTSAPGAMTSALPQAETGAVDREVPAGGSSGVEHDGSAVAAVAAGDGSGSTRGTVSDTGSDGALGAGADGGTTETGRSVEQPPATTALTAARAPRETTSTDEPVRAREPRQAALGWIEVEANRQGDVYVDGERAGSTRDGRIAVPAGPHEVWVVADGQRSRRERVTVEAGATETVRVRAAHGAPGAPSVAEGSGRE